MFGGIGKKLLLKMLSNLQPGQGSIDVPCAPGQDLLTEDMKYLVAGLGNPGKKYEATRHNVGFGVAMELANRFGYPRSQQKFKGQFTDGRIGQSRVGLLCPETFMNLSGESVQPALAFFKLSSEQLIVVHDDLDLPLGTVKVKLGGGHGGHNGLRDISKRIGQEYIRIRLGIGRPAHKSAVSSYVLSQFSKADQQAVQWMLEDGAAAIEMLVDQGLNAAQEKFNQKKN